MILLWHKCKDVCKENPTNYNILISLYLLFKHVLPRFLRVATLVLALVLVEPTVALLAGLHDLVAAEGTLRGLEAVPLRVAHQHVQNVRDVPNGAG